MSSKQRAPGAPAFSRAPDPKNWTRPKGWQEHAEDRGGIPGRAVRHNSERRLHEALDRLADCEVEIEILRYALAVERRQVTPAPFPGTGE